MYAYIYILYIISYFRLLIIRSYTLQVQYFRQVLLHINILHKHPTLHKLKYTIRWNDMVEVVRSESVRPTGDHTGTHQGRAAHTRTHYGSRSAPPEVLGRSLPFSSRGTLYRRDCTRVCDVTPSLLHVSPDQCFTSGGRLAHLTAHHRRTYYNWAPQHIRASPRWLVTRSS